MRKFTTMSLMLLFTGLSLGAEEGIPDGLRVSLVSDQPTYFLGENILLHYRIENAGETPFKISMGGDRYGGRADRLNVSANMEGGGAVADPTPVIKGIGRAGGGPWHRGELAPGASWYESLQVIRFCRFDQPGKFTIRAFHDLGFGKPRERDAREVSVSIELLAPTEAQAEAILTAEEKLPPHYGNSWGEKGVARLDYESIRWPTFLKPLASRAQNGNLKAIDGIASIRNLDATRELVRLLGSPHPDVGTKVVPLLELRLPLTQKESGGPRSNHYVRDAWDASLVPEVRDYALKLLASRQRDALLAAARLLQRVGTPSEVPALIESIEFAMAQKTPEYAKEISYTTPVRAGDALLQAALACDPGLTISPGNIRTPGQMLLFIGAHCGFDRVLSAEQVAECARILSHELPYLRLEMLDNLPKEIPPSLATLVTERMTDTNTAVQNYAFDAAIHMQEPRHREIALAVLGSADDDWLLRSAQETAIRYGARFDCARLLVKRLALPQDTNGYGMSEVLSYLFKITVGKSASGGFNPRPTEESLAVLRESWEKFLVAQEDQIQAGHLFRPGDGDMPSELLPDGFTLPN